MVDEDKLRFGGDSISQERQRYRYQVQNPSDQEAEQ